jgi:predicted enzyme related to lactoylglutathione lyase
MSTTTGSTTVSRLASVIIPVEDQDAALRFYTESLGFETRVDMPFDAAGGRWIEVAPSGGEATIALTPPGPVGEVGGKDTGISLQTDDIDGYHAQLRERGVDVDAEVNRVGGPVPPVFWLRDPEGNRLMVVELP